MSRRKTELLLVASIIAALVLFVVLGAASGLATGSGIAAWLHYYANDMAGSLKGFLYYSILLVCLVMIILVVWSLGGGFLSIVFPKVGKLDPRRLFRAALSRSYDLILIIAAIAFVTIVALAMGEANEFAPARLKDATIIGVEHAVFGTYVFAALGNLAWPHWLLAFIIFSFNNMALALIIVGIILAYAASVRTRELIVAFCIGILAMVPLWLLVPVLSPQDRFINDVYHLPTPSAVVAPGLATAIANYHPEPQLAAFLQSVRNDKAGLPALPTSTMPSAHIFWATIAGWYLFRAGRKWRWLAWLALPFLAASSLGTILLAQHYFLDVPVGLAIAAAAILLAHDFEAENKTELAATAIADPTSRARETSRALP